MKILAVIHDFLPRHQAGSELYCFHLCRSLQRRGHEVRILCTEIDHTVPAYTVRKRTYENLPIIEIVQHFYFHRFEETYRNPAVETVFSDILESWRPEVVHFHHLLGLSFGYPRLAKDSGAVVVFTLHDYWLLCLRGGGQRFLDDGTVCHGIDPERCAGCVAEFGLLSRKASRFVKGLLTQPRQTCEIDLRDELQRASVKRRKRSFVKASDLTIGNVYRPVILAHPPSRITYRVNLGKEPILLFSHAMVPSTYDQPGEGVRFRVRFEDSTLWENYLNPKNNDEDKGWHPVTLDLPSKSSGKLILETDTGPGGNPDFCAAVWGNPRVIQNTTTPVDNQTSLSNAKNLGKNVLRRIFARRYEREARERLAASREIANWVDRFICPSPFLERTFEENGFPGDRLLISDYGIRPIGFSADGSSKTKEDTYPIRFAFVGSLVRHKGVHVLIRAFNNLDPRRAVLKIHGATDEFVDYVEMLRSLVRNPSIEFCGRFENENVATILGQTDVLVVPSIWFENSPITIHEAFLARVPVITARFGGMADLVKDGVNGLLFETGDAEDLRKAMQRIINKPSLLDEIRPDPTSVKTLEENTEEMEELYRVLAGKK